MIYLIGMMGCGKTSRGKAAAQMLGLPFYDTDAMAEKAAGRSISEIFAAEGEAAFRALESETIASLERLPFGIAATGGGAVLLPANVLQMKRTGTIVWITRGLDDIKRRIKPDGRPLLKNGLDALDEIYSMRKPLYEAAADLCVAAEDGAGALAGAIKRCAKS